jgi:hypothetical protein
MKYLQVVEAIMFTGENAYEVLNFAEGTYTNTGKNIKLPTVHGILIASIGDYVVKDAAGRVTFCPPDIFREIHKKA